MRGMSHKIVDNLDLAQNLSFLSHLLINIGLITIVSLLRLGICGKINAIKEFTRGLPVIDGDGYRLNVGIVICNNHGQVFWAKRYGQHSWQFLRGNRWWRISRASHVPWAIRRGWVNQKDVKVIATSRHWLRYKLPKRLVRWDSQPVCIGQKQKWFLLRLECDESKINMQRGSSPEFDGWRWVSYWYPVRQVVSFKRDVYRRAMKEFASLAMPFRERKVKGKRNIHRG